MNPDEELNLYRDLQEAAADYAYDMRKLRKEHEELRAAASDILLSFTAGTECRIPHHQVERLFRAVHGVVAKTPWDDDKDTKQ